jgi:transporter family-2 protein
MIGYILIAALNGAFIGTSRALNGRLSASRGPMTASLWNHVVGCAFLTVVLCAAGSWRFGAAAAAPGLAYLGGFIGALYVAVNSYVFVKLGAMNAALLIISGQMTSAVFIEYVRMGARPPATRWLGVAVVLLGVYMTQLSRLKEEQKCRLQA